MNLRWIQIKGRKLSGNFSRFFFCTSFFSAPECLLAEINCDTANQIVQSNLRWVQEGFKEIFNPCQVLGWKIENLVAGKFEDVDRVYKRIEFFWVLSGPTKTEILIFPKAPGTFASGPVWSSGPLVELAPYPVVFNLRLQIIITRNSAFGAHETRNE